MDESRQHVAYLIFDVEAVADGNLVKNVRYPKENLTPAEAITKYRADLLEKYGNDVIPPTFVVPAAVAVAKVDPSFRIIDVAALDAPLYRPYEMTKRFWQGWRHYKRPPLVTFNGRGYDLPVLELAAYRFGLSLPDWFNINARTYEQSRNRYNTESHLDMMDLFSNFSAYRITGGLNLLANILGKPGKTGIAGSDVQNYFDSGHKEAINDYCRCDVLDTYFVFLRTRVLLGQLPLEEEQVIMNETKDWLESHRSTNPAYDHYLTHWGDWERPQEDSQAETVPVD
jgi:3'-5' exonuclease